MNNPSEPDPYAEIAQLRRLLALAESAARHEAANADHWRANHHQQAARCALLRQRPDLPVDRIPAYDELVRLQTALDQLRELQDRGPWRYRHDLSAECKQHRYFLQSDDFGHDVRLYLDGDFSDDDQRAAYGQTLAAQLNAAEPPRR